MSSSSSSYGCRSSYLAATFHKRNAMFTSHSSDINSAHNITDDYNEPERMSAGGVRVHIPHDLYPDPAILLE